MKFAIGIQARSKSSRLPGKCLMLINGKPMWRHVYDEVKDLCDTFVLVPFDHEDSDMWVAVKDVPHMCGPMDSPRERYEQLLQHTQADMIIRITADCPLINRFIVMDMMRVVTEKKYDYLQCEYDGMDVQIMSGRILRDPCYMDKEHVVDIREIKNQIGGLYHSYEMHLSVDTQEQFNMISRMMDRRKHSNQAI